MPHHPAEASRVERVRQPHAAILTDVSGRHRDGHFIRRRPQPVVGSHGGVAADRIGVPDLSADQGLAAPGSWNALQAMFDAVRSGLVGRPVAVGSARSRVAFTLTSLEATVGHMAAAAGQVDDVSLSAENCTWRSFQFVKVSARLGNFHTRFRSRPLLVSAPVDVSAVLTGDALDEVLAKLAPAYRCEITDEGNCDCGGRAVLVGGTCRFCQPSNMEP